MRTENPTQTAEIQSTFSFARPANSPTVLLINPVTMGKILFPNRFCHSVSAVVALWSIAAFTACNPQKTSVEPGSKSGPETVPAISHDNSGDTVQNVILRLKDNTLTPGFIGRHGGTDPLPKKAKSLAMQVLESNPELFVRFVEAAESELSFRSWAPYRIHVARGRLLSMTEGLKSTSLSEGAAYSLAAAFEESYGRIPPSDLRPLLTGALTGAGRSAIVAAVAMTHHSDVDDVRQSLAVLQNDSEVHQFTKVFTLNPATNKLFDELVREPTFPLDFKTSIAMKSADIKMGSGSVEEALSWQAGLPGDVRLPAASQILERWLRRDSEAASAWALTKDPDEITWLAPTVIDFLLGKKEAAAAEEWLRFIKSDELKSHYQERLAARKK